MHLQTLHRTVHCYAEPPRVFFLLFQSRYAHAVWRGHVVISKAGTLQLCHISLYADDAVAACYTGLQSRRHISSSVSTRRSIRWVAGRH